MADGFQVLVATGDKKNAGTDANVSIILHGQESKTEEIVLDNFFRNDFERGKLDIFKVPASKMASVTQVEIIELWRDHSGISSDWYVDKIVVENTKTHERFVFPVLRWIKEGYRYKIRHLDTSLPQFDEYREQREMQLEEKRKLYQLEQKAPGMPAQIKAMPDDELFSFDYKMDIVSTKIKSKLVAKLKEIFTPRWKKMEDLSNLYSSGSFPRPKDCDGWKDDLFFGRQRIAGGNNILIKLCTSIPEKLPVTDEMLEPVLEGNQLKTLLEEKRIFICDLEILDGIQSVQGLKLCAPIALLMVDTSGDLRPIAIQLNQKPGKDNPIFLPTDPPNTWILAKMWFNNSDAAYHQSLSHLAFTHLLMEGVAVISHRQLSQSHPIFKILAPHFLYLIAINSRALQKLVSPGGWIDVSMTTGANGMFALVQKGINTWRVDVDGSLPEDLKTRGLDDPTILPNYHYREDGLLVYNAIQKYVSKYVDLYYDTEDKITGDNELNGWAQELARNRNEGGVGLLGVPNNGFFKSKEDIVTMVTCVIFTCSGTHAAANFLQYEQYGFPANFPSLLRGSPPTTKEAVEERRLIDALPLKSTTLDIMTVTKILSARGTNSLGNYEVEYVFDPKAVAVIEEFRSDLKEISNTIKERNKNRKHPYDIFDPELIPNAISI